MDARDFYRKLNTKNEIKDFGGYGDYTADQMIWFAEEYAKQAIPLDAVVSQAAPQACAVADMGEIISAFERCHAYLSCDTDGRDNMQKKYDPLIKKLEDAGLIT